MREETMPHGFVVGLTQNEDAANTYAMMTREEKEETLKKAEKAGSKRKMRKLLRSLAEEQSL